MTWNTKNKSILITKDTPHLNSNSWLADGLLPTTSFQFTPAMLYGAIAQCSHLHSFSPWVASIEWTMAQALVQHHVNDTASDFELETSVNSLKDFMKGSLAGALAAGIAYLTMIQNGYNWHAHFEKIVAGNPKVKKRPDFVFIDGHHHAALTESKGSATGSLSSLDKRTNNGYVDQVEPHLGQNSNGLMAHRGFCIGSYLKPKTKAQIRVHRTSVSASASSTPPPAGASPAASAIVRANYARVFSMVHSARLGTAIANGEGERRIAFFRIERQGYRWLFAPRPFLDRNLFIGAPFGWTLAIEQDIAERSLRLFLDQSDLTIRQRQEEEFRYRVLEEITPFEPWKDLISARDGREAFFPDGLAVIEPWERDFEWVEWDGQGKFLARS